MTLLRRASEQGRSAEARLASLRVRKGQPGGVPEPSAAPLGPPRAAPVTASVVAAPATDPPGPARVDRPPVGAAPSPVGADVAAPSPVGADVAASPRSGLLPSPLRGGRWAPGHRGALALVGVAVLAALLAGVILLRGRPVEVTAPAVTGPGVTGPGVTGPGVTGPGVTGPGVTGPGVTGSAAPSGTVVVAVAGKVRRPGLVRLPIGSRVDDALRAAGGVVAGTDPGLLNLARLLVDGEQVLVGVAAAPGSGPAPSAAPTAGGKVNLNTATVADLDTLPGIGPVLAQHVVDWRTKHGRFASIDQLREVPGIGEAKYASLRDKVQV